MQEFRDPSLGSQSFDDIDYELKGTYQQKNKRTILCAIHTLEDELTDAATPLAEAVAQGMTQVCQLTGLVGRWQTLGNRPLVICDTGHNVGGWQYLAPQIASQPCDKRRIVFGMVDDKDINTVMEMLPADAMFYWCRPSTHRAIPQDQVQAIARQHGLSGEAFPDVLSAYRQALADASPDDFIFVGGSSYVVADLLAGK